MSQALGSSCDFQQTELRRHYAERGIATEAWGSTSARRRDAPSARDAVDRATVAGKRTGGDSQTDTDRTRPDG